MKFSDIFKDMDEVKKFVESLNLNSSYKRDIEYMLGLLDNEGDSDEVIIDGEKIMIDKGIVQIIRLLNTLGFKTLASCSGLKHEHRKAFYKSPGGYISILKTDSVCDRIRSLTTGLTLDVDYEGECYLKPSIAMRTTGKSDADKKKQWNELLCRLIESGKMAGQICSIQYCPKCGCAVLNSKCENRECEYHWHPIEDIESKECGPINGEETE